MTIEKHVTVKQFAETFSLAEITVRQWIKNGKIESVKIGSSRRIPEREIERLKKG